MRAHALVLFAAVDLVAQTPAVAGNAKPFGNGRDLTGWHGQRHHDPYELVAMAAEQRQALQAEDDASMRAHWRVEDGVLVNDGEGAFLTTDAVFGDAEFCMEYRTVAKADSGLYLRGCPQVQIWDTTEAGGKWKLGADKGSGGLWNNEKYPRMPLVLADKPFGEWNSLRVVQVGERVWVWLNQKPTVDGVVMENYWNRGRPVPPRGPLQLQTHGGEIRFRNLTVREIGGEEAKEWLGGRDEAAFVPLFDGKTFTGWRGDVGSYEIVDGAICCRPGQGGNLFTEARYTDFTVRLEFRLPPGGNNGLAIRYPGQGDPAYAGCELQVLDDGAAQYETLQPWQRHGSVYGVVASHTGYLRPVGQWNHQEVTVRGSRYTVVLNGTTIVDADVATVPSQLKEHVGKDNAEGHFGFCGHGDPVAFRNVRIKQL